MYNSNLMKVLNPDEDLMEKFIGLFLVKSIIEYFLLFIFDNVIKKLPILNVLCNQEKAFLCLYDFIKLNQIWMNYFFKDLYFSHYPLLIFPSQFRLVYYFYCHFLPCKDA